MRVSCLVRAETPIGVFSHLRRGDERSVLAQIIGAAHAHEASFFETVLLFRSQCDRVDHRCQL
jgi:hypothetical protein